MHLLIAGSRNYKDAEFIYSRIDLIRDNHYITKIIAGGATGVDQVAKEYAKEHNIPFEKYKADWDKYGKAAGPIRNKQMVDAADIILAIRYNYSPGTSNTLKLAKKAELKIYKVEILWQ